MVNQSENNSESCCICGSSFEGYRADTILPYIWIELLSRKDEIDEFHSYQRPAIEVCADCQSRVDYVIRNTCHNKKIESFDETFMKYILKNISEDDVFDATTKNVDSEYM